MNEIFQDLAPLARGLDAAVLRHKVISGNLANLNTPGYIRREVQFEELLREQLESSPSAEKFQQALSEIKPKIIEDSKGPTLEQETGALSRNEILYNLYSEILTMKISQLKFVIGSTK